MNSGRSIRTSSKASLAEASSSNCKIAHPQSATEGVAEQWASSLVRGLPSQPGLSGVGSTMELMRAPLKTVTDGKAKVPPGFIPQVTAIERGSGGRPIPSALRSQAESSSGEDFKDVRLHTGPESQSAAHRIGAKAFALGRNIHFNSNRFAPGTPDGKRLLFHEMAHTAQQRDASPDLLQRDPSPLDPFERKMVVDAARVRLDRFQEMLASGEIFLSPAQKTLAKQRAGWARTASNQVQGTDNRKLRKQLLVSIAILWENESASAVAFFMGYSMTLGELNFGQIEFYQTLATATDISASSMVATIFPDGASWIHYIAYMTGYNSLEFGDARVPDAPVHSEDPSKFRIPAEASGEATPPGNGQKGGNTKTDGNSSTGGTGPSTTLPPEILDQIRELDELSTGEDKEISWEELIAKLETMDEAERLEFLTYLRKIVRQQSSDEELVDIDIASETFKTIDPVQRELIRIRQDTVDKDELSEKDLKKIGLDLGNSAEKSGEAGDVVDQIRSKLREDGLEPGILDQIIPAGWNIVFSEALMLEGLLVGAGTKSDAIGSIGKDLIKELHRLRKEALKELGWMALQTAAELAILYGSAGTTAAANIASLSLKAKRLLKLIKLMDDLKQLADQAEEISDTIKAVADFQSKITDFEAKIADFETRIESLRRLEESLEEGVDIEAEREKIGELLLSQLNDKWDEILGRFYLPDDMTPDEVIELILDLPRGFDALKELSEFYQSGNRALPSFDQVLVLKAFHTGQLLYPFVGFLAGLAVDKLKTIEARTFTEFLQDFATRGGKGKSKKKGHGKKGKKNRDKLGTSFRGRKDLDEASLKKPLKKGFGIFLDHLKKTEPDDKLKKSAAAGTDKAEDEFGAWPEGWFKFAARDALKALNKQVRSEKKKAVWQAKLKKPKASGTKGKKKAKSGDDTVPIPPFRIRFSTSADGDALATLKLNPTAKIEVNKLTYDNIPDTTGLTFRTNSKQRNADFDRWLSKNNYRNEKIKGRQHLRMEGGKTSPGFLYISANGKRLMKGFPPNVRAYIASFFEGEDATESDDLPEGYYIRTENGKIILSKKAKTTTHNLPNLGFENGKLKLDANPEKITTVVAPPITREPTSDEDYEVGDAVESMFDPSGAMKPEFNDQGVKWDKATWKTNAENHAEMKRRPTKISGGLGYVVNAVRGSLQSKRMPELKRSDDKGHLVAARFGGIDEVRNLVPMKRSLNQGGAWYQLEDTIAKVFKKPADDRKHPVDVDITLRYPHKKTRRPNLLIANWTSTKKDGSKKNEPKVSATN